MIEADRALQRTSQLRKLCLSLQESGHQMRISQKAEGFLGSAVDGVYCSPTGDPGYDAYFVRTCSGMVFRIEPDGRSPRAGSLPGDAAPMQGMDPILRGPKIVAVHEDWEQAVYIVFSTGHALCVDMLEHGNGLCLESPEERDWQEHLDRYADRIL